MKSDRINYVVVGSFVLSVIVLLVVTLAVLTGRTGTTDTYFTRFADVTGLKYGSQVLYMGFPVGQVEEIRPVVEDGTVRFELELSVIEDLATWKVPRDSFAQVRAAGLLAAVTVDIRAGASADALRPGDRIRGIESGSLFGAVSETANTVRDVAVSGVKPLIENLNRYVSSIGDILERRGGPLVDNLARLSQELAERAPSVIDDFLATTRDLRAVSARLEALLSDENAGKLGNVVDNVLAASDDVARLTASARTQVERIAGAGFAERVTQVLTDAGSASGDLAASSASLRAAASTVLAPANVQRVERTVANLEAASASARDIVGPSNQRKVGAALDSAARAAGEIETLATQTRSRMQELLGPDTVARVDRALVNITSAAANVATLSAHLDERAEQVLTPDMTAKLRRALENFSLAAGNVAALSRGLEESRGGLDALLSVARGIAEDNREDLRATAQDLRYSVSTVAEHIDAVAQSLEGATRNMLEFSRRLKANPGLLLRSAPPPPDGGAVGGGG